MLIKFIFSQIFMAIIAPGALDSQYIPKMAVNIVNILLSNLKSSAQTLENLSFESSPDVTVTEPQTYNNVKIVIAII